MREGEGEGRGLSMEEDGMMMGYMDVRKPDEKTPHIHSFNPLYNT